MYNTRNPEILVEGVTDEQNHISDIPPFPTSSWLGSHPTEEYSLPTIEPCERKLDQLLRKHQILGEKGRFWTSDLLKHILRPERVHHQLSSHFNNSFGASVDTYVHHVCGTGSQESNEKTQSYLKIFSILVLIKKDASIQEFVAEQLCDEKLPVALMCGSDSAICLENNPEVPIDCVKGWHPHEREAFERLQWEVSVPFFKGGSVDEYHLRSQTILPWCKQAAADVTSRRLSYQGGEGAYAKVFLVKIHPAAHGFKDTLRKMKFGDQIFAIKQLNKSDIPDKDKIMFERELAYLKRFNGYLHQHLVTLLCSFTIDSRYNFVFPAANRDLEYLFQRPKYPWTCETVRWASQQLAGLMGALDAIHNPTFLDSPQSVQKYGRHGDIKAENILCFDTADNPAYSTLVIADFGLSALNSDKSRSNIPNNKVPAAPGYRPPECDVEGGTVSRDFDVWTIGCLFLEFITWLAGGPKLLEEFEKRRTTVSFYGSNTNTFFKLMKLKDSNRKVAQVKPEITNWINHLRQLDQSSQFILEALKLVEDRMLIILSLGKRRSLSKDLKEMFEMINSKCNSDRAFCICKATDVIASTYQNAVEAPLNEMAIQQIQETGMELELYEGDPMRPMSWEEKKEMALETIER